MKPLLSYIRGSFGAQIALTTAVCMAFVAVLGGIGLPAIYDHDPRPAAYTAAAPAQTDAIEVPTLGTQVDTFRQEALRAKNLYPEYYQCAHYPGDIVLTQEHLVPTINVVITIKFDRTKGIYTARGDRNKVGVTSVVHPYEFTSDGAYQNQAFQFTFGPGVKYYRTYVQYKVGNGESYWSGVRYLWEPKFHKGWMLHTELEGHDMTPQYVILATDTNTCAPSPTKLPSDLDFGTLARKGELIPEYSASRSGWPQG